MQSKKKLPLSKGWYCLKIETVLLLSTGVGVGVGGCEEKLLLIGVGDCEGIVLVLCDDESGLVTFSGDCGSNRLGPWSTSGSTSIGTSLGVALLFTCAVLVGKSCEDCSWVGLWWWCEPCCEWMCLVQPDGFWNHLGQPVTVHGS